MNIEFTMRYKKDKQTDFQGKSKEQIESSMILCTLSGIGLLVVILWTIMGILVLGK